MVMTESSHRETTVHLSDQGYVTVRRHKDGRVEMTAKIGSTPPFRAIIADDQSAELEWVFQGFDVAPRVRADWSDAANGGMELVVRIPHSVAIGYGGT